MRPDKVQAQFSLRKLLYYAGNKTIICRLLYLLEFSIQLLFKPIN